MRVKSDNSKHNNKDNDFWDSINSSSFQRIILSCICLIYSIITMFEFGIPEQLLAKLKAQTPSLTLTFLALVTGIEISDRLRKEETYQKAKRKLDKLSDVEEKLISRCAIEIEGESPVSSNFLQGTWLSLYQDQDSLEYFQRRMKWATEIIEIIELGSVLYLYSKADQQNKLIQALGRHVKDGVILGHWINCGEVNCKQGEFLLEISRNGKYLFGYYNRPNTDYKHFYKWILIKAVDKAKGLISTKESILENLNAYLGEAWDKVKQIEGDELTSETDENGNLIYDNYAVSFENLINNIPVVD